MCFVFTCVLCFHLCVVFSAAEQSVDLCVVFSPVCCVFTCVLCFQQQNRVLTCVFCFQQENGDMLTKKGDFVFSNDNLVEIVAKVVLVIQSLTGKQPEVQVSPR